MADVEARVDKLCRGMLIMAQQGDTARAAAAAKMLRETVRDLDSQAEDQEGMLPLVDQLREALRGVIILLKPLLATPDQVAEEFNARSKDLVVAVQNFSLALSPAVAAVLAPTPAPPPTDTPVHIIDPNAEGIDEQRSSTSNIETSALEEVISAARLSTSQDLALKIPVPEGFTSPPVSPRPSATPATQATPGPGSPRPFGGSGLTPGPGSPRPISPRRAPEETKQASSARLINAVLDSATTEEHPLTLLHKLLMEHEGLNLVSLLATVVSPVGQDIDEFATSLTLVFAHAQADLELLQFFVNIEVPKCTAESTLFRGADFASKLISAFGRTWSAKYLYATLDPVFEEVSANKFDYEVDPNKLSFGIDIKKNQSRLTALCIRCVEDIIKSAKNFPVPLKALYAMVQAIVVAKFPKMKYPILGGLFFLRYIEALVFPCNSATSLLCPALLAPDAAGLRKLADERARRALLLVGKFLQNMGNDVMFERKEAYMSFLNDVLHAERERIQKFFDELVELPEGELEPANPHLTDDLALRALAQIRRSFATNLPKLQATLKENKEAYDCVPTAIINTLFRKPEAELDALNQSIARLEKVLAVPFNDAASFPPGLLQAQKELSARTLAEEKEAHAAEYEALREARRCIRSMSNFGVVKQLQMNNLVPAGGKPAAGSTSGRGSNNAAPPVTSPRTPAAAAAAPAAKAVPKQLKPPTAEEAAKTGTRGCWLHVQFKGKKWDHRLCFLYEHLMCFYTGHKDPAPTYVIKLDKWAHIELPTGNCDKPNSLAITGPGGNYMLAFSCIQDTHAWLKSMTANQKEYLQKNSK